MTKRDFATTFGLGMLIGLWSVGLLALLSLVAGCSADADHPDTLSATVVPPLGAVEQPAIRSPVVNCVTPMFIHHIDPGTAIVQKVNSSTWVDNNGNTRDCPGEYYWDAEPREWSIRNTAPPPVRYDNRGTCTWSGAPTLTSAGCVWDRTFTCPYDAANGGPFVYNATVIAQDVNWFGTTLRLHISSHSGQCARLLTAKFDW